MKPVQPVSLETYMKWVEAIVPKKTVMYVTTVEYEDHSAYDYDDNYSGPRAPRAKRLGRKAILMAVSDHYQNEGLVLWGTTGVRPPRDMKDIAYIVALANGAESEWGTAWVETPQIHKKNVKEELKKKYEGVAGMIAQKYNVKAGSLKFVVAAKRHYKRIVESERRFRDDPEIRMERWAAATMGGAGRDNYFKDNDYSSSLSAQARDELGGLMDFMSKYFPLTMLEYEERQRARKKKGNHNVD